MSTLTSSSSTARRMPLWQWAIYQVVFPLFQVMVGVLIILVAKTKPRPIDLLEGITLSIFAVTILSGVIGTLPTGTSTGVSAKVASAAKGCFVAVLLGSVILVALYYTRNIANPDAFILAQLGLALIALPAAWAARP